MVSTPTPSVFGDYEDCWYDFAYWLWLAAQDGSVTKKEDIRYAKPLDEVPGASEYFRWLCQYDLYFVPISFRDRLSPRWRIRRTALS